MVFVVGLSEMKSEPRSMAHESLIDTFSINLGCGPELDQEATELLPLLQ